LADSVSIGAGYFPVAVSFGLAAVHAGLSPLMAAFISVVVYAGASQFILISLVASAASAASVVGIVLLMNLRHVFYGPSILARLERRHRRLPLFVLAAGLTDEVFATSVSRLAQQPPAEREGWYAGLQLGAYMAWVGGTVAGAWFGRDWIGHSAVLSQTLGFVLPALFFALLLEIGRIVPFYVLAGAAAATLAGLLIWPAYAAIMAGMLVGAALGGRGGRSD